MTARIDHTVTSGTFSLDGQTFDVDNNVWVVGDEDECIVIDAPHDIPAILDVVAGRRVQAIVCTHGHDDHVRYAPALGAATGAPVLLHPDDLIETDHRFVPSAVFSNPQVASVGATEQELRAAGTPYVSGVRDYADVAYGWAMADSGHFAKLLADPETGLLLGAHILGPDAANLIQPLIQAMSFGLTVPEMARGQYWIHPALTEVVENALLDLRLG